MPGRVVLGMVAEVDFHSEAAHSDERLPGSLENLPELDP